MGVLRTISRNIVSNATGYLVSVVVALLLTPFVVRTLGDHAFGAWTIVVALTGYYGILDLGIRSAVGQYLTRYWARGDLAGVNRTMTTAVALTLPAVAVLLVASIGLAWAAADIFDIEGEEVAHTRTAILVMGTTVAFSFPLAVFGAATYARQRFDIANVVGIGERLATAGLTVWVLKAGHGLVGLALATAGVQMLGWCLRVWIAFRLLPGLRLAARHLSRSSVRELLSFGIFNFLINLADRLVLYTDVLIIGIVMSNDAVTHYSLGSNFINYYVMLVNSVAWTLTPYATSCDAAGDREALRRLWAAGSRNLFLFAALIGGGLIFLGRDFLAVWMGPAYVSGAVYTSSATVMAVLATATLVRSMMTCGKQILFGMRHVEFLAAVAITEAIANVALAIALVHLLGLLGVALAALVPVLGSQLVVQPLFLARRLGMPLGPFLLRVARGGLLVIAAMGLVAVAVQRLIPVHDWPTFLLKGTVVTVPAVVVGLVLGTTAGEKRLLLGRLGRRR
jgi:O-antigen/teichoic acid export membrane protein